MKDKTAKMSLAVLSLYDIMTAKQSLYSAYADSAGVCAD